MGELHDHKNLYMVVFGYPFGDGMTAYGPFDSTDDALEWAQEGSQDEPWDIVVLHKPEEYKR